MFLPEELLIDILIRLPVKSLVRFECVCGHWNALIKSSEFIRMHLNCSSMRILIGTAQVSPQRYCLYAAEEFGSREKFIRATEKVCHLLQDFPYWISKKKNKTIKIVGSCNGLVCVQYSKYGVLVWNPWIRKHWTIPRTRVETGLCSGSRRILPEYAFGYGFGYDEANDDYKVVRIVQFEDMNGQHLGCEAKVFSMRSNSWNKVKDFPYTAFRRDAMMGAGVLANGALHWLLSDYDTNPPNSIVAIDLTTEEHRILPEPGIRRSESVKNFGVLDGHLCLFTNKMWMMQEYGKEDSWIELEAPEDICFYTSKPIAYWESEKILIMERNFEELLWYNEDKASVDSVTISCINGDDFFDFVCGVESLVEA